MHRRPSTRTGKQKALIVMKSADELPHLVPPENFQRFKAARIQGQRKNNAFLRGSGRQISEMIHEFSNKPICYPATQMVYKSGDVVQVMEGEDKGKVSKIIEVNSRWNRCLVAGIFLQNRRVRPMNKDQVGQLVQVEGPVNATRLMHYDEEEGVAGHCGFKYIGKKPNEKGKLRP